MGDIRQIALKRVFNILTNFFLLHNNFFFLPGRAILIEALRFFFQHLVKIYFSMLTLYLIRGC